MSHRLLILTYHQVLDLPDPLRPGELSHAEFERQMSVLARFFNVLPLRFAVDRLREGRLPSRACAITFDDGYEDNHRLARPVLLRYGLPATFFVATGYLDGGRMWNDTLIEAVRRMPGAAVDLGNLGLGQYSLASDHDRAASARQLLGELKYREPAERQSLAEAIGQRAASPLPEDLMMTSDQVRSLAADGFEIGGHTVSHPILNETGDAEARREIENGKGELEQLTGTDVALFAYPNGQPGRDYSDRHAAMVRDAGFRAAVSTAPGAAEAADDPLQLPRFGPWAEGKLRFGLRAARLSLLNR